MLIGEPGKRDNKIFTNPVDRTISLLNIFNKPVTVPYYSMSIGNDHGVNFTAVASKDKMLLYPNESISFPLPVGMNKSVVNISVKRKFGQPDSKMVRTDGKVKVKNSTNGIIMLPNDEPFIDVRSCYELNMANQDNEIIKIRKIYDISRKDWSHFIPSSNPNPDGVDYSKDVTIDDEVPAIC